MGMTKDETIEILEKEKFYMLRHGGVRQAVALDMAIKLLEQEHTGTWIEEPINNFKCSCCGEYACDDYDASGTPKHYKFCPNCGAKMVEEQGENT